MLRKLALTTLLFLAISAFLTACDDAAAMSYAPSAYGENGRCYYADDPHREEGYLPPGGWMPPMGFDGYH